MLQQRMTPLCMILPEWDMLHQKKQTKHCQTDASEILSAETLAGLIEPL